MNERLIVVIALLVIMAFIQVLAMIMTGSIEILSITSMVVTAIVMYYVGKGNERARLYYLNKDKDLKLR